MAGPAPVTGQNKALSNSGTTVSVTLTSAITAGNMLGACATTDDATPPSATAISDTAGNTWTRIVSRAGPAANGSIAIFVALNVTGGSYAIKFTNATSFVALSVAEFNPNGQSTADGTAGNSSTAGSSTPDPGSITTANANDVLLSGAVDSASNTTWTAGTGYTLLGSVTSSANTNVGLQSLSVAATGTYASAFGNSATSGWCACACAIKAVVVAASPRPQSARVVSYIPPAFE